MPQKAAYETSSLSTCREKSAVSGSGEHRSIHGLVMQIRRETSRVGERWESREDSGATTRGRVECEVWKGAWPGDDADDDDDGS